MAAGGLFNDAAQAVPVRNEHGGLLHLPHHEPKAKRVIYLTQSGGPSQIELYDHKPDMHKWAGDDLPEESNLPLTHVSSSSLNALASS